ncbi:MAG: hypothetical protein DWQ01_11765 [Planctomycetota bacterium]|nr:MAG: hypothetical protein DWQ01_11765 [Planctomycetota bacterium]
MRRWLLGFLGFGLSACAASAGPPLPVPADLDVSPLQAAIWQQRWPDAERLAEDLSWAQTGSIEGERLRQRLLIQQGRRGQAVAELRQWRKRQGENPDLDYLESRLIQHRDRQERRFQALAEQYPGHAWIRLAAAARAQDRKAWDEAETHLQQAPPWMDARELRAILVARQLEGRKQWQRALQVLEPVAWQPESRDALFEYEQMARRHGQEAAAQRAKTEIALRRMAEQTVPATRMDLVMSRVLAEIAFRGDPELEESLQFLEEQCNAHGLPAAWTEQARYRMSWIGSMLRPETEAGGVQQAWRREGRLLLAGEVVGHGMEWLYLRDCRFEEVPWPGQDRPILLVLAGQGFSSRPTRATGGATFRGFFLRRDLLLEHGAFLRQEMQRVEADGSFALPPPLSRDRQPDAEPPEDWDLPLRLRAARRKASGWTAERLEFRALLAHECGHLPEVLPWLPDGPSLFAVLPDFLLSWLRDGDPLTWMEFRAQARALASGVESQWLLAQIVERARGFPDRYQKAYRRLLNALVVQARKQGLAELPWWHQWPPEEIQSLAQEVCRQNGIEMLPPAAVLEALEAMERLWAQAEAGRSEAKE